MTETITEVTEQQETLIYPDAIDIVGHLHNEVLPDPDTVSYYVLENERKIYLETDVDASVLGIQKMIMRWNIEDLRNGKTKETAQPIWIYIMSYGGDLDYMWALIDAIKMSVTPIYTVNIGTAASAASLIFVSGHKRFMTEHATVVIHEGSAQLAGDAIKVQDAADTYKKQLKQMKDFILEHTGIPKSQLMKKRSNDWTLNSDYCAKNNVCDKIITDISEIL